MKIYDLDGVDIDEVFQELEAIKKEEKEARKEVRAEAKERKVSYKFKLSI